MGYNKQYEVFFGGKLRIYPQKDFIFFFFVVETMRNRWIWDPFFSVTTVFGQLE